MSTLKPLKRLALMAGLLAVASTAFSQSTPGGAGMSTATSNTEPSPGAGNLPVKGTNGDNMNMNTTSSDHAMAKKKAKKAKRMHHAKMSGNSGTDGRTSSSSRSDVDASGSTAGTSGMTGSTGTTRAMSGGSPGTTGAMSGASAGAGAASQPAQSPNDVHATPTPGQQSSQQSKGH